MPEEPEQTEDDLGQIIDRIAGMLVRQRWLIIGTACTAAFGAILVSFCLPNRYTSEATLFVVQQQVPERYVVSTTTADLSQTLDAMAREALSRPRLLAIINEVGLYSDQKNRLGDDGLIELARRDVSIEPLESRTNAFRISFIAPNPQLAQTVTNRLTTLFIEQNLKSRADQATTTTGFLREQLDLAKNKLTEQEQLLRDFKMKYLGELPEQQQGNLGMLGGAQTQLDNVMASRNQAQQQRLYLESLLSERQRLRRRTAAPQTHIVTPLESAQQELSRLQAEKRALLNAYTPQHPDVLKKEQEIKTQQTFVENLKAVKTAATPERPPEPVLDPEEELGVAQLKSQLQANALEIENLNKKELRLRNDMEEYRSRLNLTPVREQQLTSMQRDYDLLKQHYGDLLKKEQESQLATNLEKRQEGQQFRLADPPNLPTKPSSPKRAKISLAGVGAGLLFGCVLAFLREVRKGAFHAESDAKSRLALPLIVGIPAFFTPAQEKGRSRRRMFEWAAGSAVALAVIAAELFVYRHG